MIFKSAVFIGVLKVFVALSSEVEDTKKLSLYAVGVMLNFYLCFASLVKLFGVDNQNVTFQVI